MTLGALKHCKVCLEGANRGVYPKCNISELIKVQINVVCMWQ